MIHVKTAELAARSMASTFRAHALMATPETCVKHVRNAYHWQNFCKSFLKSCDSAQLVFCENVFVKDVFWCLALVCTLSDPCQNNATCIEIGDGVNVNCSCLDGYTDPLCQTGAFDPRNVAPNANCYMCSVFHIFGPISRCALRI